MTTPNALAARIQSMDIASEQKVSQGAHATHVLSFKFPAVELLSPGVNPFFSPPTNIQHRQYPTESSCQTSVIGTDFCTVLHVGDSKHPFDVVEVAYGDYQRLTKAIDNLKLRPGESFLDAVVYNSTHENATSVKLKYRLRLTTTLPGNAIPSREEFELDEDQWASLMMFEDEQEWIFVLFDLLHRRTERAVLETRKNMIALYGANFTMSVEDGWADRWLQKRPPSVEQLFQAHFFASYDDLNAVERPGDCRIDKRLECGHDVEVRKIWVESIQGRDCLLQKCPHCGRRIMTTGDEKLLQLEQEWDEMELYREETASWLELDRLPPFDHQTLFDSKSLISALWVALDSFDMPESECPPSFCPLKFAETEAIATAFHDAFDDQDTPAQWRSSAADQCGELAEIASEAEEAITNLTPGLEAFVNAWVMRAVNLLTHRPCRSTQKGHFGVRKHRVGWYFNPLKYCRSMSANGEDEDGNDEDMDLEDLLNDMRGKTKETTIEEDILEDDYRVTRVEDR